MESGHRPLPPINKSGPPSTSTHPLPSLPPRSIPQSSNSHYQSPASQSSLVPSRPAPAIPTTVQHPPSQSNLVPSRPAPPVPQQHQPQPQLSQSQPPLLPSNPVPLPPTPTSVPPSHPLPSLPSHTQPQYQQSNLQPPQQLSQSLPPLPQRKGSGFVPATADPRYQSSTEPQLDRSASNPDVPQLPPRTRDSNALQDMTMGETDPNQMQITQQNHRRYTVRIDENGLKEMIELEAEENGGEEEDDEEILVTIDNVNVTHYKNAKWRPLLTKAKFMISRAPFDKRTLLWKIEGVLAMEKSEKLAIEKQGPVKKGSMILPTSSVRSRPSTLMESDPDRVRSHTAPLPATPSNTMTPPPIDRSTKRPVPLPPNSSVHTPLSNSSPELPSLPSAPVYAPPPIPSPLSISTNADDGHSVDDLSEDIDASQIRRRTRPGASRFDRSTIASIGVEIPTSSPTSSTEFVTTPLSDATSEDIQIETGEESAIWGFYHNTRPIYSPHESCYVFPTASDEPVFVQFPLLEVTKDMADEFDWFIGGWTIFIKDRERKQPLPLGCTFTPIKEPQKQLTNTNLSQAPTEEQPTPQKKKGVAGSIESGGVAIGGGIVKGAECIGKGLRAGTKFYIKHTKPDAPSKPSSFSKTSSKVNEKVSSALLGGTCFFLHGLHRGGEVIGGGIAKGIYLGVSTYQSTDYAKKKAEEEKRKKRLGQTKPKKDNAVVAVATSTVAAGASIISGFKQAVRVTATDVRDTAVERTLHKEGTEAAEMTKKNYDIVGDYALATAHTANLAYTVAMCTVTGGAYAAKEVGMKVGTMVSVATVQGVAGYDSEIRKNLGGLWKVGWLAVFEGDLLRDWEEWFVAVSTFSLALYKDEEAFELDRWNPRHKFQLEDLRGVAKVPKELPKRDHAWQITVKTKILFFSLDCKKAEATRDPCADLEVERDLWIDHLLAMATLQFPTIKTEPSVLGFGSNLKRRDGLLMKKGDLKKNWKLRWFALDKNGDLSYYKSKDKLDKPLRTIKRELLVDAVATHTVTPKEKADNNLNHIFTIKTRFRDFEVSSNSMTDMQAWIEAIQSACPLL